MSSGLHIIRKNSNPDIIPTKSGIHWINEASKEHWFSVGNSSLSDWVKEAGNKTMFFEQISPLTTWIVNHNFGTFPIVQVFDLGGRMIDVEVNNLTVNQLEIVFLSPKAGYAKINI
jgi:hypothetical protein